MLQNICAAKKICFRWPVRRHKLTLQTLISLFYKKMSIYSQLFGTFFRIGSFTIGGGYAMIPLIEDEIVTKKQWIDREAFLDLLAVAQTVPGVFAVNISINIGYRLRGTLGAIVCALGCVLPSFLIISAIALFFHTFQDNKTVAAIFKGVRPAVVALIAVPCIKLARSAGITLSNVWLPVGAALLIWLMGVSPVYIIFAVGLGGYLYGRYVKPHE